MVSAPPNWLNSPLSWVVGVLSLVVAVPASAADFRPYTGNCLEQSGDGPVGAAAVARDSQGRTYKGYDRQAKIFDPVEGVSITLNRLTKTAIVTRVDREVIEEYRRAGRGDRPIPPGRESVTELGIRRIEGFRSKGYLVRFKKCPFQDPTICMEIRSEVWIAEAIGLHMLSISEIRFPEGGPPVVNTMKHTDVDAAEPDPLLFQIPDDYQVVYRDGFRRPPS